MERELRPVNPRRPADWRWQRIAQLIERGGRVSQARDDVWIVRGRRFLSAVNRCQTEEAHVALACNSPEMYEPWALFEDTDDQDTRWAIEARLLAREDYDTIAQKTGYTPAQVEYYHQWFFDVHDRLASTDLITTVVFSKSIHAGLSEREYDCLWKMFGYHGGGHVLDMLINKFAPRGSAEKIVAFFKDDFKSVLAMKGDLALRTMPINWQTQVELANLYLRMEEMERQEGQTGGDSEGIIANVKAFFGGLPWAKASQSPTTGNEKIDRLDRGSVAVRASELTLMGTGQTSPFMQSLIESASQAEFPGAEGQQSGSQQDDS